MKRSYVIVFVLVAIMFLVNLNAQDAIPAESDPVIAAVFGEDIRASQGNELRDIIFGRILEDYIQKRQIEPTAAEIAEHVKYLNEANERNRKKVSTEQAALLKQREDDSLTDSQISDIEKKCEQNKRLLDLYAYMDNAPEKKQRVNEKSAANWLLTWKMNEALYEEYGGRVVFQQLGPEPLDAYRSLLEEAEAAGVFIIYDKSYEPSFWNYFTNVASHSVFSREEGAKAMNTRWWLLPMSDNQNKIRSDGPRSTRAAPAAVAQETHP